MIKDLGWKSLEEHRAVARLTLIFKIMHNFVDINLNATPLKRVNTQTE